MKGYCRLININNIQVESKAVRSRAESCIRTIGESTGHCCVMVNRVAADAPVPAEKRGWDVEVCGEQRPQRH